MYLFLLKTFRYLLFYLMMGIYLVYAALGMRMSSFPIDYPYGRDDTFLPPSLRRRFHKIIGPRIRTGNNQHGMEHMRIVVKDIHRYCLDHRHIVEPQPLPVLFPFQRTEDRKRLRDMVQNKHPFVIRGGSWKTIREMRIAHLFSKYGNTTVMFDTDQSTFKGKLQDMQEHGAYLSNSTSFMKKHPEIVHPDDIQVLEELSGLSSSIRQIFLSLRPNNGTRIHAAFSHNFFFMVEGRKKWTFWHPDYLCLLYPAFPASGIFMGSYTGVRDLDTDNIDNFPLMRYAPRLEIELQEGDVLFNPGPWWHAIRNLTPHTLGYATRWIYPHEYFPSPNLLQYYQITNPMIQRISGTIYANTGGLRFDVDENMTSEMADDGLALIEILNHEDVSAILNNKNRHKEWHLSLS